MPVSVPTRSAAFILSDSDGRSLQPQRRSLQCPPRPAFETKASSSQNADKHGKSIGHRIMHASMKRGDEKTLKKEPGSAVKKSIFKSTTPGSDLKKIPARKMPDFKKLHQQLFNNMESLAEYKKRQQDRAQGFLQSRIVPRCAILSPGPINAENSEQSSLRKGVTEETKAMPMSVPTRSAAFILSHSDGRTPQRRSLQCPPRPAFETKTASSQNADTRGKSIGHRIMKASTNRGYEKTFKKEPGTAVRKSIVKSTTPDLKKIPASKMPDFKKLHQQVFNNMESLAEYKKRQQDRAQGFLQSGIVPRCATLSPGPINAGNAERSLLRKVENTNVRTPVVSSPPVATKLKTSVASPAPVPVTSSVNRSRFRRPVKKGEITNITKKKLTSVNWDKIKEQDQNVVNGVRMNTGTCFTLPMQMRQMGRVRDKREQETHIRG